MSHSSARALIELHHYSHSWPSALRCYGLYQGPFCIGAVVLGYPMNEAVLRTPFPDLEPGAEAAEIARVLLLPGAAFNAASWTLRRVFELEHRRGTRGLVSFADPVQRTAIDGTIVLPGHTGITYQALGGVYAGRSTARTLKLLPDATALPARSIQKVRAQERGWQSVVRRLVRAGFPAPADGDLRGWITRVQSQLRPLAHPGNHRYLFALDGRVRLPESLPYPTTAEAA
jgi:hypothetical protein